MAVATIEEAIANQWAASGALVIGDPVTSDKLFIGQVPLVTEDETGEVLPSYAWVESAGLISEERTSERVIVTERVRLTVENEQREFAALMGTRTHDAFKRPDDITYQDGTILMMKRIGRTEKQGDDGMWRVSQEFSVLYTVTE